MFDTVSGMISAVAQDGFYIVQEFNVDDPTDLITVVDLPNRQVLQCEARHLVPVDTKWCPENQALGRRDETSGRILGVPKLAKLVEGWVSETKGPFSMVFYIFGNLLTRVIFSTASSHSPSQ